MSQNDSTHPLTSAMEDYLEAIYHLEIECRIARVRDIAKRLDVKMSSVTAALKVLGARGLIKYDPHEYITLTEKGVIEAKEIVRKHEVLKRFLVKVLQVNEPIAEDNACRIEHQLDPEVIEKLVRYVEFTEMCPVDQTGWLEKKSSKCENCAPCLDQARQKLLDREEAQTRAIAGGMTLAEAQVGNQVLIDRLDGPANTMQILRKEGLDSGTIVEIEGFHHDSRKMSVNIKGYHVKLDLEDASHVFIKPI